MTAKETYSIIFRDQGGGGWAKCNFQTLVSAVKFADKIFNSSSYAYYVIEMDNCKAYPYGEIAVFRGDEQEYVKNNGLTFQQEQARRDKWARELLQIEKENN